MFGVFSSIFTSFTGMWVCGAPHAVMSGVENRYHYFLTFPLKLGILQGFPEKCHHSLSHPDKQIRTLSVGVLGSVHKESQHMVGLTSWSSWLGRAC